MIEITTAAKVAKKEANPYSLTGSDGNPVSGISRKVRLLIGMDLFDFKFKRDEEALFNSVPEVGQETKVRIAIESEGKILTLRILEVLQK